MPVYVFESHGEVPVRFKSTTRHLISLSSFYIHCT